MPIETHTHTHTDKRIYICSCEYDTYANTYLLSVGYINKEASFSGAAIPINAVRLAARSLDLL